MWHQHPAHTCRVEHGGQVGTVEQAVIVISTWRLMDDHDPPAELDALDGPCVLRGHQQVTGWQHADSSAGSVLRLAGLF